MSHSLRRTAASLFALLLLAPATHANEAALSIERVKKDVYFLASEECEGRGPETAGINKAADYIAAAFKDLGLKPLSDGTHFQNFTIPGSARLGAPNRLLLEGPLSQK